MTFSSDITKLAVNPLAATTTTTTANPSIWTPEQAERINKTDDVRKVTLPTTSTTESNNNSENPLRKRKFAEVDPAGKSQPAATNGLIEENEVNPIEPPKKVNKQEPFSAKDITAENTEAAFQEVARKIIRNDDRIDEIFTEMQEIDKRMKELDDLAVNAKTPLEKQIIQKRKEIFQKQMDELLDEMIVRCTLSYCQLTQEDIFRVRKLIRDDVEQLQSAMKDKTTMIIICLSGAISIGGAGLGFAPGGILGFSAAQVKAATNVSASIGQGGSLLAQQNMQSAQGRQKVLQDLFVTVDQNVERDRGDAKNKAQNLINQLIEIMRTKHRDRHSAWQSVNS